MQLDSTPTLKKRERFTTGNQELDALLIIYHDQGNQMAIAEEAGLPVPVLKCPQLPKSLKWRKI